MLGWRLVGVDGSAVTWVDDPDHRYLPCDDDRALIAAAPEMLELLREAFPDPRDVAVVTVRPDWRIHCLALLERLK